MKRYRVRLVGESAISLDQPARINLIRENVTDVQIDIYNNVQEPKPGTLHLHRGFFYDVSFRAENVVDALQQASAKCRVALDLLSTSHGAAVAEPRPLIALDLDEDSNEREFAQLFRNIPMTLHARTAFTKSRLGVLVQRLKDTDPSKDGIRRIWRGLYHLRRSILETDLLDRFQDLWNGLETINPLIGGRYGLDPWYEVRKCRRCGEPQRAFGASVGIRHVVVEMLGRSKEEWNDVHQCRQTIVHGKLMMEEILPTLGPMCDMLRDALMLAVLDLLDVPESERDVFLGTQLPIFEAPQLIISAVIDNCPLSAIAQKSTLPHLKVEEVQISQQFDSQQGKRESIELKLRAVNTLGLMSFRQCHTSAWGSDVTFDVRPSGSLEQSGDKQPTGDRR